MMDQARAEAFAAEWIALWNALDIEGVLSHYSEDVRFHSPLIAWVLGGDAASVVGKATLRDYWRRALGMNPSLHFDLQQVLMGSDTLTILYRNHRNQDAAESFVFEAGGKVILSMAAYAERSPAA